MSPQRIQRKRDKGWRMPEGAVYVGRPTKWGNPFVVGGLLSDYLSGAPRSQIVADAKQAFDLYDLHTGPMGSYELDVDEVRKILVGKDLACWCPLDQPCHADVLLRIANGEVAK